MDERGIIKKKDMETMGWMKLHEEMVEKWQERK